MRVTLVGTGLIDVPPPGYGAIERYVWHVARELRLLGHDARIVSRVFAPTRAGAYRFAAWARREVARESADVVHLTSASVANVFGTLGPRPFVFTTNTSHWAGTRGARERLELAVEARACRLASTVVAVSQVQRDAMRAVRRLPPVHVVPNGVDVDLHRPRPDARTGTRVLGIGFVGPRKRWHVAAEALRGVDATLTIAGPVRDPEYAARVKAAAPGQVELLGALDEKALAELAGAADVLVHPAEAEGFPFAVLEGMASGLPVVGTTLLVEGVTEGEHGFLAPRGAPEAEAVPVMREAFERLLADDALRARMGAACRARAEREFAWARVAERLVDVYRMSPGAVPAVVREP